MRDGRRTAVVGAGWAGLAAACALRDQGAAVTVFEAAHEAGGRARRLPAARHPDFAAPLDNGQHLLLGAYADTLALIQRLGVDAGHALWRLPLRLDSADGSFALRAPRWPAPMHVAAALFGARGLALRDKLAAARLIRVLRGRSWRTVPGQDVAALWQETAQTARTVRLLWLPLCLAALNTPAEHACAQLFATVLRDSLGARRADSDLLLPRVDLTALWPAAAARRCEVRYGHTVREIALAPAGLLVDGEPFDDVVVATAPRSAARLLGPLPGSAPLAAVLDRFEYLPIATLNLRLQGPFPLPFPMMMLFDDPASGRAGQWVFDRSRLLGLDPAVGELTVVISAASGLADRPRAEAIDILVGQLAEQLARHPRVRGRLPALVAAELIVDKRATFKAVPGLERPANRTPWPRLAVAGDWTDTGYPATLEGAVRSGLAAARELSACRDER